MNIVCIVQARMGSERLPGKVLKQINGKPMIKYTLDSLSKSKYINKIILATSNKKIDDNLAQYVSKSKFDVFRGSEQNVLERYKLASDKYSADIIVRVTGDCPLIDPLIVDNIITKFLINEYDYLTLDVPETFLRGFDIEILYKKILDKVYDIVCKNENIPYNELTKYKEHVTYYIYKNKDKFKIGYLKGEKKLKNKINYSVDTIDDFKRVEKCILKNEVNYKDILKSLKELI